MRTVGIFLFLFFYSYDSLACRTLELSESSWIERSNSIYVVRVVGVSAPTLVNVPYSNDQMWEAIITTELDKRVSLVVYETLKGSDKKIAEVTINWCGGGEVKLGSVGVLYGSDHQWHIKSGINAVTAFKEALTSH
jgi:hypothetical protein